MMKLYTWATLIFLSSISVLKAQVAITTPNQTYTQDFNSLDTAGGTNAFSLLGWQTNRDTYRSSNGSSTNGDVYSFGENNNTERALGGIPSSSVSRVYIGASFKNTSDGKLNEFNISYKGEQWRRSDKRTKDSSTPLADTLVFEYSTNATGVNDATANWKRANSLNFISPIVRDTVSVLNGNLAANSQSISGKFNAELSQNSTVYIRWAYIRNTTGISGSRDGLAVDDFSITFKNDPTWEDSTAVDCNFDTLSTPSITKFENTTTSLSVTFNNVEGASGYLILLDEVLTEEHGFGSPVDGITYSLGNLIDETEVIGDITTNSFTYNKLNEEKGHQISIVPYYICEGSIFYGAADFFEFYTVEACEYPDLITTKILNVSPNSTSAEVTLMKVKDAIGYIILMDQYEEDHLYGDPEVGSTYQSGDYISESRVVYVGTSLTTTITDLLPLNTYEIYAYPIFECEGVVSYGYFVGEEFTTTTITSIKENISNNMLIYPNPISGNVLNIKLNNATQGKANVQIFSIVGSQIYSEQRAICSNMQLTLPNELAAGRYTVKIEQDGQSTLGSFVIVR